MTILCMRYIINANRAKRGDKMKDVKRNNEVKKEEIQKLADMYRRMTPANRFFMVSASGLLLASQSNAEKELERAAG